MLLHQQRLVELTLVLLDLLLHVGDCTCNLREIAEKSQSHVVLLTAWKFEGETERELVKGAGARRRNGAALGLR